MSGPSSSLFIWVESKIPHGGFCEQPVGQSFLGGNQLCHGLFGAHICHEVVVASTADLLD